MTGNVGYYDYWKSKLFYFSCKYNYSDVEVITYESHFFPSSCSTKLKLIISRVFRVSVFNLISLLVSVLSILTEIRSFVLFVFYVDLWRDFGIGSQHRI